MERTFYSDTPPPSAGHPGHRPRPGPHPGRGGPAAGRVRENKLEKAKPPGLFRQVLAQLRDPMILVLLAAAALLLRRGRAGLAGHGHHPAHRGVQHGDLRVPGGQRPEGPGGLGEAGRPRARVLREGGGAPAGEHPPGPRGHPPAGGGDYVPADGRILWAAGLQTDESAMTGESLPVHKRAGDGLPPTPPGRAEEHGHRRHGGHRRPGQGGGHRHGDADGDGEDRRPPPPPGPGGTPLQRKMKEVSRVLSWCAWGCAP